MGDITIERPDATEMIDMFILHWAPDEEEDFRVAHVNVIYRLTTRRGETSEFTLDLQEALTDRTDRRGAIRRPTEAQDGLLPLPRGDGPPRCSRPPGGSPAFRRNFRNGGSGPD